LRRRLSAGLPLSAGILGGGWAKTVDIVPQPPAALGGSTGMVFYEKDRSLVALRPRFSPGLPWFKGVFSARRLGEGVKTEKNTEFVKKILQTV
jgi:hypothetical protein